MSNTDTPSDTSPSPESPVADTPLFPELKLKAVVAERLARILPAEPLELMLKDLTDKEVQKRSDMLAKGMALHAQEEKTLKGMRPDVYVGSDGKQTTSYTKQAWDQRSKQIEKVKGIVNAIAKATEDNDWAPLTKVLNSSNGGKPADKE